MGRHGRYGCHFQKSGCLGIIHGLCCRLFLSPTLWKQLWGDMGWSVQERNQIYLAVKLRCFLHIHRLMDREVHGSHPRRWSPCSVRAKVIIFRSVLSDILSLWNIPCSSIVAIFMHSAYKWWSSLTIFDIWWKETRNPIQIYHLPFKRSDAWF